MTRSIALKSILIPLALLINLTACNPNPPSIVVITATPLSSVSTNILLTLQPAAEISAQELTTPVPSFSIPADRPDEHTVLPGESLSLIAQQYGTTLDTLVRLNNLSNPDRIEVGQIIMLPSETTQQSPDISLLPDRRFVRGPDSLAFDTASFIALQTGYIRMATDIVTTNIASGAGFDETLSAGDVIERVSMEYSIDPRLLLAVLEYRAQWLTSAIPRPDQAMFPIISLGQSNGFNRPGLYRQLAYAANELNRGYYSYKTRGLRSIAFSEGVRVLLSSELNAATVAIMYFFSLGSSFAEWQSDISSQRFMTTYRSLFGDPFMGGSESPVPTGLEQPEFALPFAAGETWLYTGGPHGGWGSGSAWASLDFAPPDERLADSSFCYSSITPVRAVADGILSRSTGGAVVLDMDGDADERTGWTVLYLHLTDITSVGTTVKTGDIVGYASCAGGFSTATHLHIARRYNGEWLAADCSQCIAGSDYMAFTMSGWIAEGLVGQEYQGYLVRGLSRQIAEQGRQTTINQISW